jgi:hypothetical protein
MGKNFITGGAAGAFSGAWCIFRAVEGLSIWPNARIPFDQQAGNFIVGLGILVLSIYLFARFSK